MVRKLNTCIRLSSLIFGLFLATQAHAGAIISTGNITMGINDTGELNVSGVGLSLAGLGDALSPGCPCEGWGVEGSGESGWANQTEGGAFNLTLTSFSSNASSATSVVQTGNLQVSQAYAPSASPDLFENIVTITNLSSATVTDVLYRRVMDWDIPPTPFTEGITIGGLPASNVVYTSDNGFETARPNTFLYGAGYDIGGCGINTNFTDCGPFDDHGALFDLSFGDLAPGESLAFSIFYGGTYSEADAFAALAAVQAEVYSFGQHEGDLPGGTPGTYIWAFKGVGGTPVDPGPSNPIPEPSAAFLFAAGLGVAARARRSRR